MKRRHAVGGQMMFGPLVGVGADLVAGSLTEIIGHGSENWHPVRPDEFPAVARINGMTLISVEEAAGPQLEVLAIGTWPGEPLSLAAVAGLPRLRTLYAQAGTLANTSRLGSAGAPG